MSTNRAVFFDKDGTLIYDVPYNVDLSKIEYQEGIFDCLRDLQREGFLIIVITNQSGIAKGLFKEEELQLVRFKMEQDLWEQKIVLNGFYFCPHHPCGNVDKYTIICECKKPKHGMFMQASQDFDIDLTKSWMVGDILNDIEAGNNAGCQTILIRNGNEDQWEVNERRVPSYILPGLHLVAPIIIEHTMRRNSYEKQSATLH